MTKGEYFQKKAKCKHGHCGLMSNSAWTDLNSHCTVLKLHDICGKSGCKCQSN